MSLDAIFTTIERITNIEVKLRDYRVRSVTVGEDAQGEALIEVEHDGQVVRGRGVSTDIVEASAQAFLQVINRIAQKQDGARLNAYDMTSEDAAAAGVAGP